MRIAFVVSAFPKLSETFILSQITGLIGLGHEVDVYAASRGDTSTVHPDVERYRLLTRTHYSPNPMDPPILDLLKGLALATVPVLRHPLDAGVCWRIVRHRGSGSRLRLLYDAIPFLGRNSYDIVHCHFGPNALRILPIHRLRAVQGKLVTTFYGYDVSVSRFVEIHGTNAYEKLFRNGDCFLAISERMKNQLIGFGCTTAKVRIHHIGVDCSKFRFSPRQKAHNEKVRIITVARLVEKKGVEYGIRAISRLASTRADIEYCVIGDGPLRSHLEQLIANSSSPDTVRLLGWQQQEDVIETVSRAHILLAPSVTASDGDQEGVPVAIMEAMALGLPVVSTLHSGIPELVEDGVSGFLVPERDSEALVDRLAFLIDHPEAWSRMGAAGRARVEKHYNAATLNSELVMFYQELIG